MLMSRLARVPTLLLFRGGGRGLSSIVCGRTDGTRGRQQSAQAGAKLLLANEKNPKHGTAPKHARTLSEIIHKFVLFSHSIMQRAIMNRFSWPLGITELCAPRARHSIIILQARSLNLQQASERAHYAMFTIYLPLLR